MNLNDEDEEKREHANETSDDPVSDTIRQITGVHYSINGPEEIRNMIANDQVNPIINQHYDNGYIHQFFQYIINNSPRVGDILIDINNEINEELNNEIDELLQEDIPQVPELPEFLDQEPNNDGGDIAVS